GFLAIAPDALSAEGGTPEDPDKARELFSTINAEDNIRTFINGLDFLSGLENSNGKLACVGYCCGGALANQLAVHAPELKLAVAYYGRQASTEDVPRIKAKLQLHYGKHDERVNAGISAYE